MTTTLIGGWWDKWLPGELGPGRRTRTADYRARLVRADPGGAEAGSATTARLSRHSTRGTTAPTYSCRPAGEAPGGRRGHGAPDQARAQNHSRKGAFTQGPLFEALRLKGAIRAGLLEIGQAPGFKGARAAGRRLTRGKVTIVGRGWEKRSAFGPAWALAEVRRFAKTTRSRCSWRRDVGFAGGLTRPTTRFWAQGSGARMRSTGRCARSSSTLDGRLVIPLGPARAQTPHDGRNAWGRAP